MSRSCCTLRRRIGIGLVLHALHLSLPLAGLLGASAPSLKLVCASFFFLGAFTLTHDAMHGALGLPRLPNELLLTMGGLLIGVSAHAARRQHLEHHRAPLSARDRESAWGETNAVQAFLRGLVSYPSLPLTLLPASKWTDPRASKTKWQRHARPRELLEWLAVVVLCWLCARGSAESRLLLLVTMGGQLTLPFWGGYLPHHAGPTLLAVSRALAWTRLPIFTALASHAHHHACPKVPSYSLVGAHP